MSGVAATAGSLYPTPTAATLPYGIHYSFSLSAGKRNLFSYLYLQFILSLVLGYDWKVCLSYLEQ